MTSPYDTKPPRHSLGTLNRHQDRTKRFGKGGVGGVIGGNVFLQRPDPRQEIRVRTAVQIENGEMLQSDLRALLVNVALSVGRRGGDKCSEARERLWVSIVD